MGAAIVGTVVVSGFVLYLFAISHVAATMGIYIALTTMIFMASCGALIIWTDDVRAFYSKKHGLIPTLIKIITFPIWLFGILFCAWGAYETAKGVRNWMHKND